MATLQPYNKYSTIAYDYITQLPDGWRLLPNIAIFQERIERGHINEELLSVTIGKGVIKQTDVDVKKDSSNEDKSKYKLIKIGDIAYNKMRMWQGALGYSDYQGISSPAYVILKPKMKINPRYFHYMFRTSFYTNYSKRFSYGIVDDQLSLRYTDFKRMYSIVPPLEVQNSIVAYLDKKNSEIDKFILNKERLIELLEEERKEMIDEILNSVKATETNVKPLKYLVRLISDLTTKKGENETYLALENIESWTGKIDLSIGHDEFESAVKKFKNTDVLFSKLRPYLAKVVIPDFNGVCVSEILVFRPSKLIDKEFIFYKLISRRFIDYVDTSTYGSKMPRANYDFIGKIEVEYPINIDEQKSIVQEIKQKEDQIEGLKNKYRKEISSIKEYREALITDLVTGRRSVPQLQMSSV
jgi:type I restriction enzyme S subunit